MSDRYIERGSANIETLEPNSARQKDILSRIEKILNNYTNSRYSAPTIREIALEIWRETRR